MGFQSIHETVVKDIIEDIVDVGSAVSKKMDDKTSSVSRMNSIARASSALTAVFPVVCSTSVDYDHATKIMKAIERKAVTMLQIVFTSAQITNAGNALDYLKKFHTNLDDKATFDEFEAALDSLTNESAYISETRMDPRDINKVYEDARNNLNYYFESDISETSLSDYIIEGDQVKYNHKHRNLTDDEKEFLDNDIQRKMRDDKQQQDDREANNKRAEDKDRRETEKHNSDIAKAKSDIERAQDKEDREKAKMQRDIIQSRLVPQEVKKANEMVPTLMMINFRDTQGNKDTSAVIGVKAKLYPVEPEIVMSKLITKHQDSHVLLNLIRASTREISFVKDFLFAIDKAKLDAIANSRKSSATIFKALERRSLRGKIRKLVKGADSIKCITTLVISIEEAEEIKKYNHIDVLEPRVIVPIMEKLNLLYFIVVDQTSEVIHLFEDGQTMYEDYTMDALDKESGDFSYKKVVNLITRMAR